MQENEWDETSQSEIEREAAYDPIGQQLMIFDLYEDEVVTDIIFDAPTEQVRFLEDFEGNILIEFTNEEGDTFIYPQMNRKGAESLTLQSRLI